MCGVGKLSRLKGNVDMNALLILPEKITNRLQIERVRKSLAFRLKQDDTLIVAAVASSVLAWQQLQFAFTIESVESITLINFSVIAYCSGLPEQFTSKLQEFGKANAIQIHHYPLMTEELFHPPHSCNTEIEYPYLYTHIFNAVGSRNDNQMYYYPYNYLFRCSGMGPTNEFGFRISGDVSQLSDRPPQHKVITVFGGSAGWCFYCLPDEMFSTLLEKRLNEYCQQQGLDTRFTVLNFSQHGNVCMNEIITFMQFCHRIKPDIVIAHDGFNDLLYGQISDPYLLNTQQITYQHNLENWSEILHETKGILLPEQYVPGATTIRNFPRATIQAYCSRLMQFQDMVTASGGTFIAGLQPMVFSKKKLSKTEGERIETYVRTKTCGMADAFNNMSILYDRYIQTIDRKFKYFANMHHYFSQFGDNLTLFGDVMHTNPTGDSHIADYYTSYIVENILNQNGAGYGNFK